MNNYEAAAKLAGVRVSPNYSHSEYESLQTGWLWYMVGGVHKFKMCSKIYSSEDDAWKAACVDNNLEELV